MSSVTMQFGLMRKLRSLFPQNTTMPKVEASVTLKLYRSIHELPLILFIYCICAEQTDPETKQPISPLEMYRHLIINGEPTETELVDAWQDILQQYTELIAGNVVSSKLSTLKRTNKLETKLIMVENLLDLMKVMPSKEFFDQLYTFNYPLPKKEYSERNLLEVVKIFISHYKLDRNRYKLANLKPDQNGKEAAKVSMNDFTKMLNRVSIAFKLPPISVSSITTAQYCNYFLEYQNYCQELEKQSDK